MSYDIELKDPITKETIEFDEPHQMKGGTYQIGGTHEAWLNITWNYSEYYYEATENDPRFFGKLPDDDENDEPRNLGIRGIYGKTGAESLKMLADMIYRIDCKYKKDGEWISTERDEVRYIDKSTGKEISNAEVLHRLLHVDDAENTYIQEEYKKVVSEGYNNDYWTPTAENAIRPLLQLVAMAQMRPDGIWKGD